MKSRNGIPFFSAFVRTLAFAMVLAAPVTSSASITQTLLSEKFSSTSFPPPGWTAGPRNYGTSQPCSYATQAGWYRSSGNPGAVSGVGSAVCWTFGAYSQNCYGTPTYGPCTLVTPSISLANVAAGDSQYVDFDAYLPASYYDYYSQLYYGGAMGHYVEVLNGSTVVQSIKIQGTSSDMTYYSGRSSLCLSDPSSYTSTSYWRHYRVALGSNVNAMQLTFRVKMYYGSCRYSYWYSENVAITNVLVTNIHFDILTMNGPDLLNFGRVPYHNPSPVMYTTFTNNSSRDINLTNIQVSGPQAPDFAIVSSPSVVPVGASDSIGVVFTAQGPGGRYGTLTFNTDADIPKLATIPLQGFGLQSKLDLPLDLHALFTQVHVPFGDSAHAVLQIFNSGGVPLHLSQNSFFTGDHPEFYSVSQWPASGIEAGMSDSLVFTFSPYIEGGLPAQFHIVSDASNGDVPVNLRGVGVLPHLIVSTGQTVGGASTTGRVDFGAVAMGDSVCRSIALHNTGSDTLTLNKQIVTYGDYDFTFTLLDGSDVNLAPDVTKLVTVCFKPLQRGARMASLRFYTNISPTYPDNADTSQSLVQVMGTAVPYGKLAVSGSLNDSAIIGQTHCIADTIWNTGAADLRVDSVQLSGVDASLFAISGASFPATITANSFLPVQICYSPTARGLSNASLSVAATSSDRSMKQTLSLLGVGQLVCMDATPNPVAFGSAANNNMTLAKMSDTTCIAVKNCGDVPMSFKATNSGTGYSLVEDSISALAPGATGNICVVFSPDTIGVVAGSVTITSDQSSTSPINLSLAGTGAGVLVAGSGQPQSTAVGACDTFDVTLTNTGNIAWTPGTATISGSTEFSVASAVTPNAIPAGGTGTVKISYCPMALSGTAQLTFPAAAPMPLNNGLPYILTGTAASGSVAMRTEQDGFSIGASYPNPATNSTSVIVTLPRSAVTRITLIRLDGVAVQDAFEGSMSPGDHVISINTSALASGTYFLLFEDQGHGVRLMREIVVSK